MKIRTGLGLYPRAMRLANNLFDYFGLPLLAGTEVINYKIAQSLSAVPHERVVVLTQLLTPKKAVGQSKVRLGRTGDGGYISLDTGTRIRYALSFGIEGDDSWDIDCANRGIQVYQYDYSIDQAPHQHTLTEFYKKKIGPKKTEDEESIASVLEAHSLTKDASVILKIDIEGSEWKVFDATPVEALKKFDQIVCEFHYFASIIDDEWYECARRVLEKLNTAFAVVHVHANNYGSFIFPAGVPFPRVLEVTFANREQYRIEESAETFPTELDSPNRSDWPDLYLGDFHFRGLHE
jgi:Methyltransferase FkbM domain